MVKVIGWSLEDKITLWNLPKNAEHHYLENARNPVICNYWHLSRIYWIFGSGYHIHALLDLMCFFNIRCEREKVLPILKKLFWLDFLCKHLRKRNVESCSASIFSSFLLVFVDVGGHTYVMHIWKYLSVGLSSKKAAKVLNWIRISWRMFRNHELLVGESLQESGASS